MSNDGSSWLLDLPAQQAFEDGTEAQPTARRWNFTGASIAYNPTTRRVDINVGAQVEAVVGGVFGRKESASDVAATIGAVALRLGAVAGGAPATSSRSVTLEALLSTTSAGVGATLDFFNTTTSQVVGAALVSAQDTGPELVTLDVTGEIGSSLTDDAVNIIEIRLRQTALNVAERAYVDSAIAAVTY